MTAAKSSLSHVLEGNILPGVGGSFCSSVFSTEAVSIPLFLQFTQNIEFFMVYFRSSFQDFLSEIKMDGPIQCMRLLLIHTLHRGLFTQRIQPSNKLSSNE